MGGQTSGTSDGHTVFESDADRSRHYNRRLVPGEHTDRDRARQRWRNWDVSSLRALRGLPAGPGVVAADPADREVLLAVYEQVGATWRSLTDVRFKLLALVPAVSVFALSQVVTKDASSSLPMQGRLLIIAIGAAVTG
jgi:hypothetical protein